MRADPLLGKVGGGWALEMSIFLAQMALAYRLDAISQESKKLSISSAQPTPTCPHNISARIKNIMHRAL